MLPFLSEIDGCNKFVDFLQTSLIRFEMFLNGNVYVIMLKDQYVIQLVYQSLNSSLETVTWLHRRLVMVTLSYHHL